MSGQRFLYLSRADVEAVGLDLKAIIGLLETAFREKGEGRVEMPPKPGIHTRPDAFIHAMAAWIPGMQSAGLKWVAGYPENAARGLPYVSGLLILNDVETGFPLAVMDCTWITAYRTGAATALSARYLARPDSSTAAILACGVQGRTHLEALVAVFPLRRAYAYDTRRETQDRYVREMSEQLGLEVIGVDEPRQAVEAADLVVTSGPILKQPKPTIGRDWLRPGAFASAVDFDSSSSPAASQAGSPQPSARWRSTSPSPSTTWPWRPKSCAASGPGYRSERRTRAVRNRSAATAATSAPHSTAVGRVARK